MVLVIWKNMFLIQHLIDYKKWRLLVQGESTLWGGHMGYFYNKYYSMYFFNVMHLILGFTFGVWVLYFDDFHKVNVNLIFLKII